jgi:putative colanic acid biosynthesis glycosyltransferase WcaI
LLAAADLLVLPERRSVADELFPGKMLHFFAAGVPIVASVRQYSEVARFIVRDGVDRLVPPKTRPLSPRRSWN